jgi:hypothetical protein
VASAAFQPGAGQLWIGEVLDLMRAAKIRLGLDQVPSAARRGREHAE